MKSVKNFLTFIFPVLYPLKNLNKLFLFLIFLNTFTLPIQSRNFNTLNDMKDLLKEEKYEQARLKLEANEVRFEKNSEYYFLLGRALPSRK